MALQKRTTVLGGFTYTTEKQIKTEFGRIRDSRSGALTKTELCFVLDLAKHHPKFQNKSVLAAVSGFGKDEYKTSRAIWVKVKEGSCVFWDTMSFHHAAMAALQGKEVAARKYATDCSNANARVAVDDQKIAFRNANTHSGMIRCSNCKQLFPAHECQVDHGGGDSNTFRSLLTRFKQSETEKDTGFRLESWFAAGVFDHRSNTVQRWREFHGKHVEFQMLHLKCHKTKSGGETTRRSGTKRERQTPPSN